PRVGKNAAEGSVAESSGSQDNFQSQRALGVPVVNQALGKKVVIDGDSHQNLGVTPEYVQSIVNKATGLEHNIEELNKFFDKELHHQRELLEKELQIYKDHRIEQIEAQL